MARTKVKQEKEKHCPLLLFVIYTPIAFRKRKNTQMSPAPLSPVSVLAGLCTYAALSMLSQEGYATTLQGQMIHLRRHLWNVNNVVVFNVVYI